MGDREISSNGDFDREVGGVLAKTRGRDDDELVELLDGDHDRVGLTERVDTRVLMVVYEIEKADAPVYVGQQVDVFIDGAQASDAATQP